MDNAALKQETDEIRKLIAEHKALLNAKVVAGEIVETTPVLKYDPFDIRQNALEIVGEIEPCDEYPYGAAVKWINPDLRNRSSTWAGWEPFQYGDPYTGENGELLCTVISGARVRFQKPGEVDSYVRRSDLILCRIDKRIWEARNFNREIKNKIQRTKGANAGKQVINKGVSIQGEGLVDSKRPDKGFRIGENPRDFALNAMEPDQKHAEAGGKFRTELMPPKE